MIRSILFASQRSPALASLHSLHVCCTNAPIAGFASSSALDSVVRAVACSTTLLVLQQCEAFFALLQFAQATFRYGSLLLSLLSLTSNRDLRSLVSFRESKDSLPSSKRIKPLILLQTDLFKKTFKDLFQVFSDCFFSKICWSFSTDDVAADIICLVKPSVLPFRIHKWQHFVFYICFSETVKHLKFFNLFNIFVS